MTTSPRRRSSSKRTASASPIDASANPAESGGHESFLGGPEAFLGGYESSWSRPHYSADTASGKSARAALAQSTSFCTLGAPLTPIPPTTSPSTLMGNPPPHAPTRATVGLPAKRHG